MSINFFDFREKMAGAAPAAARARTPAPGGVEPLTVSQLTRQIDRVIRGGFPTPVLVRAEISNSNLHRASGHLYFTMKDASACIDCVMFRSEAARLKFEIRDGMELLAAGRVQVYGQKGKYQLYATSLQPVGIGALELAFRQLHGRLKAAGLFDPERKKPLPRYPSRIAVVTSRQTAALQDVLKVLRRFSFIEVCVFHVPVQGDGAAEKIAEAISDLNRFAPAAGPVDIIIVARGGGSLEDLWEFNEECVARAIAASRIPVVTGIGHEIDTSIADLVADYHAHTPTEAAQVVSAQWRSARDAIEATALRLRRELLSRVESCRNRLGGIERHEVFRRPAQRIHVLQQRLDEQERALSSALRHRLHRASARLAALSAELIERHPRHALSLARQRLTSSAERLRGALRSSLQRRTLLLDLKERHLSAIGPQQVLKRGYSITTRKKDGAIIRRAADVKPGDRLITRLGEGQVESTADDATQPRLFE